MHSFIKRTFAVGLAGMTLLGGTALATAPYSTLQFGDQNQSVRMLQQALIRLGDLPTGADSGLFDQATATALQQYQTRQGLSVTGIADADTQTRIYADAALAGFVFDLESPDATDATAQTPSASPTTAAQTATPAATATPSATVSPEESATTAPQADLSRNTDDVPVADAAQNADDKGEASSLDDTDRTPPPAVAVPDAQSTTPAVTATPSQAATLTPSETATPSQAAIPTPSETATPSQATTPTPSEAAATPTPSQTPALSLFFANAPYQIGDSGEDVSRIQQRLAELGYSEDEPNGYFGAFTMAALGAFQQDNGLSATGIADAITLDLLFSETVDDAFGATYTTLRLGSTGSAVTTLQNKLIELGILAAGNNSGYYGTLTQAAVKAYQAANGLSADGIAGSATQTKLYATTGTGTTTGTTLKQGDNSTAVKTLQANLITLGYLASGNNTGYFGTVTLAAVKAYQSAKGLSATGSADAALQAQIATEAAGNTGGGNAGTPSGSTLKLGDSSSAVTTLQNNLIKLGYMSTGNNTGYFGSVTQAAVRAYQSAQGLSATGIADAALQAQLTSEAADYSGPDTTTALQTGSTGTAVVRLQTRLTELGYYNISIDGNYGSLTAVAVRAFQNENGLTIDGIAGETTLQVLYSSSAKKAGAGSANTGTGTANQSAAALIANAKLHLGKSYVWGGSGPNTFDCSGLVYYSLKQCGYSVDRLCADDYSKISKWTKIYSAQDLQPGDLMFWTSGGTRVTHTGIYLGNNQYIHASSSAGMVTISSMGTWSYTNFSCGRRVF